MNFDRSHKWEILKVIFKLFQYQVYFSFVSKYEKIFLESKELSGTQVFLKAYQNIYFNYKTNNYVYPICSSCLLFMMSLNEITQIAFPQISSALPEKQTFFCSPNQTSWSDIDHVNTCLKNIHCLYPPSLNPEQFPLPILIFQYQNYFLIFLQH